MTKFYNFNTERYMFGFTHESPMDSRSYKGVNQNHSLLQIFYFPPRLCCEHHACLSRCMTMMLPVYILKLMQQHKLQQTQSFFFLPPRVCMLLLLLPPVLAFNLRPVLLEPGIRRYSLTENPVIIYLPNSSMKEETSDL